MKTLINRYKTLLTLIMLVSGIVSFSEVYGQELTTLRWKNFSMQYPSGWAKDVEDDNNGQHMIKLRCTTTKLPIELMMAVVPDAPPADAIYQQTPSLVGLSYGYSVIKGYLSEDEIDKILATFGEVQLGNGSAASAHLAGIGAGGKGFAAVQSFALLENNMLLMGALVTLAPVGQVNENPAYHAAIREAYAILKSMQVQ